MSLSYQMRAPFDHLLPKSVLYFFDEPIIFTVEEFGAVFLCLLVSHEAPQEYLVVPTNDLMLSRIREGDLSLRSAFLQPIAWQAEVDSSGKVQNIRWLTKNTIPEEFLPEVGAGLRSDHGFIVDEMNQQDTSNFLSVSFKGGMLTKGAMPLYVFRNLIDEVYSSLRGVFAPIVSEISKNELSSSSINKILEIPVFEPQFASLTLNFSAPTINISAIKKKMDIDTSLLTKNAIQASQNFINTAEVINELAATDAIFAAYAYGAPAALEALSRISPTSNSPFDVLEIRGHTGGSRSKSVHINVDRGERILSTYNESQKNLETIEGRIVDTNLRSGSVIIRGSLGRETTCILGKSFLAQESMEVRNNNIIVASGLFSKRSRRDYLEANFVRLQDGREFIRVNGEGPLVRKP